MNEQNNVPDENQTQVTNEQLEEAIKNAEELAKKIQLNNIAVVRALPPQRVLTLKQVDVLLSIEENELTEEDKTKIAWATLRLKHHNYRGTDYTTSQKKKVKSKRRMTKVSRKANR